MKIYSVQEAAKVMKTSNDVVYSLINKQLLGALKLKSLKIPEYAIEEFFRKNEFKDLTNLNAIVSMEAKGGEI